MHFRTINNHIEENQPPWIPEVETISQPLSPPYSWESVESNVRSYTINGRNKGNSLPGSHQFHLQLRPLATSLNSTSREADLVPNQT
ncbi:unnamed protein product [Prunus brigantina]